MSPNIPGSHKGKYQSHYRLRVLENKVQGEFKREICEQENGKRIEAQKLECKFGPNHWLTTKLCICGGESRPPWQRHQKHRQRSEKDLVLKDRAAPCEFSERTRGKSKYSAARSHKNWIEISRTTHHQGDRIISLIPSKLTAW